ncbi:MAG: selenium cofactor biosynthesis protein YqeC [Chloroflexia bacterium]
MELLSALEIVPGEQVALVGGGGKTGLAYQLMVEARRRGWTALFTTTTRVLPIPGETFVLMEEEPSPETLRRRLREELSLFLASRRLPEWDETPAGRQQKLGGFSPEEVDRLAGELGPDLLLVEADGSRHRPFKAPAPYEPPIPAGTTLVLVLAGLSVLGRPLEAAWVHRPARAAELAGVPPGTIVDEALMARVLAHPEGGRKGVPPGARTAAVLTQAVPERLPEGRRVARRLLECPDLERVLLVDLEDLGRAEVWRRDRSGNPRWGERAEGVYAVCLAAGGARRMGQNKLLLPLASRALLAHAVDAALGSRADEVWVVLGAEAERQREALGTRPVRFLENERWAEGQASSIHAAVRALGEGAGALLFLAGDMPRIRPAHLDRLIERFEAGAAVVWSAEEGRRGIPALFARETFPALLQLAGDIGGRALAGKFPEAVVEASAGELLDVDTPADYLEAERWMVKVGT